MNTLDFSDLHNQPLVPGMIYCSKNNSKWNFLSDNNFINSYFQNI